MSRFIPAFLLLAALAPAEESAETKTARTLFESMEKKLAAAASLHVSCKAREPREDGDRHDVTFWAAGAKARMEFNWYGASKGEMKWTIVSNGESVWRTTTPGKVVKAGKTPALAIAVGFARAGSLAITDVDTALRSGNDPGDGTGWTLSEFSLGKKEVKDGVELQAVEYAVAKGKEDAIRMVLWIDVKTQLPRRRDVDISGWKLAETYEVCEVDPKIEASKFEEPK